MLVLGLGRLQISQNIHSASALDNQPPITQRLVIDRAAGIAKGSRIIVSSVAIECTNILHFFHSKIEVKDAAIFLGGIMITWIRLRIEGCI